MIRAPGKEELVPQYPDGIVHTSILGLHLHHINLLGPQWAKHQFDKLSWMGKAKTLGTLLVPFEKFKQDIQGKVVATLTGNRMSAMIDTLDYSHPQIKAIFRVLADSSAYPVQISDTRGREATGLIVCLVLLLVGVDSDRILRDYMRSDGELITVQEDILRKNRDLGYSDDWNVCTPHFVETIEQYLQTKFRGVESYLLGIGLTQVELQNVKSILGTGTTSSEKEALLVDF